LAQRTISLSPPIEDHITGLETALAVIQKPSLRPRFDAPFAAGAWARRHTFNAF
jgi:hypothetical protein